MRPGERPIPLEFRLGWLGIASAALDLGTVTIKIPAWRAGVTAGDWIEMASTYILVGLYAWVAVGVTDQAGGARAVSGDARPRWWIFPLLFLSAITFVLGHGVHLSANSIHDMLARAGLGDPEKLVAWWDERFGHDLIDVAKLGLCAGLTALERSVPRPPRVFGASGAARILFLLGVLAYGFIYFASAVEGQTVELLLPFSALYLAWALRGDRGGTGRGATLVGSLVRRFFATAFAVAIALFAIWGIWHRGFPEFSSVGLIP